MPMVPRFPKIKRLGFHYFPDTLHYTNSDCEFWTAELGALAASWLVLTAPLERAIPEDFLQSFLKAGIQPVLHFNPKIEALLDKRGLALLLEQYARWGVRHVIFYDRPNLRRSWSPSTWSQVDLVDRFLDKFIPCAEMAVEHSMRPVFPALEPGGDYWDLAFLRTALESIMRRGKSQILDSLQLGARARLINRPVDWGSGGPLRWPNTRPYRNQPGIQDHLGFHIYEWYQAASQEVLDVSLPMLLLEAGFYLGEGSQPGDSSESIVAVNTLALLTRLTGQQDELQPQTALPEEIIACCFPLVPSTAGDIASQMSWYRSDGSPRPMVDAARRLASGIRQPLETSPLSKAADPQPDPPGELELPDELPPAAQSANHPGADGPLIGHYILLPLYAWGAADWDFELISPLLRDAHPTVGFSLHEASQADRVTVVGGPGAFTDEALALLRNAGCTIDRLTENGTLIAP